jgi:hypothetical protein
MFYVDFLSQVVKISNAFIIFMYTFNVNVILTRYEACIIMLKVQKTYISTTL